MSTENNFTIRDNTSEFAKLLPNNWIEPLTIIARVKGYSGIDEYILKLIEDKIDQLQTQGTTWMIHFKNTCTI